MLGCYFLSVLRKESLEIIIFLKMLLLCILAGRWNLPIVFKLMGVPLSVYNWSFMEVRQFK